MESATKPFSSYCLMAKQKVMNGHDCKPSTITNVSVQTEQVTHSKHQDRPRRDLSARVCVCAGVWMGVCALLKKRPCRNPTKPVYAFVVTLVITRRIRRHSVLSPFPR
jgi:hypothetical protein